MRLNTGFSRRGVYTNSDAHRLEKGRQPGLDVFELSGDAKLAFAGGGAGNTRAADPSEGVE